MSEFDSQKKTTTNEVTLDEGHRLPEIKTLQNAAKLSIVEDRPIMMDYWTNSIDKTVIIGIRDDGKKMLIKNLKTLRYCHYSKNRNFVDTFFIFFCE